MLYLLLFGAALASARSKTVYNPAPVALPSSEWLGIDGNWSTISFLLGTNSQEVNVLVSTSLSEFWAVGTGGCLLNEPHCTAARGGLYTPTDSKDWLSLGTWQLGLDYLGYGGNGEYGQDDISTTNTVTGNTMRMSDVLLAAINVTDYFQGLFGLGITQASFNNTVVDSPLTQAVETFGWIPSYSYGYTAGAHYRNSPVSLTLGGYDPTRFDDQNTDFSLSETDGLARPLVRGIEVTIANGSATPGNWSSQTQILSDWNTSFNGLIDSSTPFLWLPDDVCDNFAAALNLTYNTTFELYTLTNEQYNQFMDEDSFSFTFTLSSFDNTDNYGDPLDVNGVVNITIPSRAFTSLLQYPFMDQAIGYGDPAVPYFALRKTYNSGTFILGRSFLQETYLITKYDEGVFSLHQALFPSGSTSSHKLIVIEQPDGSPYPGPPSTGGNGLSSGQIAGICVGVIVPCLLLAFAGLWYYRRRRRQQDASRDGVEAMKGETKPESSDRSLSKLLFRIVGRGRLSKSNSIVGKSSQPSEAPNSEIHELPAPVPPVELDGDDGTSLNGETELGTDSTQNMTAYEIARRKMERQLQGPVPAYTPPSNGVLPPPEKTDGNEDAAAARDQVPVPSPISPTSPINVGSNPSSLTHSLPSPITPRIDLNSRTGDLPSPITSSNPGSSTQGTGVTSGPLSALPMSSNNHSYDSATNGLSTSYSEEARSSPNNSLPALEPRTIQRTPIDPSRIVFLGELPGNMQPSRRNSLPETSGRTLEAPSSDEGLPDGSNTFDSFGSNFTVDEERRLDELTRQLNLSSLQGPSLHARRQSRQHDAVLSQPQLRLPGPELLRESASGTAEPDTPQSQGRIDSGNELIHVPQMAERRYSWEEDR